MQLEPQLLKKPTSFSRLRGASEGMMLNREAPETQRDLCWHPSSKPAEPARTTATDKEAQREDHCNRKPRDNFYQSCGGKCLHYYFVDVLAGDSDTSFFASQLAVTIPAQVAGLL